jgi:hypothetical protein
MNVKFDEIIFITCADITHRLDFNNFPYIYASTPVNFRKDFIELIHSIILILLIIITILNNPKLRLCYYHSHPLYTLCTYYFETPCTAHSSSSNISTFRIAQFPLTAAVYFQYPPPTPPPQRNTTYHVTIALHINTINTG